MTHGKPSVSELRAGEAWIKVGLWGPGPRPQPLPGRREGRGRGGCSVTRDRYTAFPYRIDVADVPGSTARGAELSA